jgi:hypothetical protein
MKSYCRSMGNQDSGRIQFSWQAFYCDMCEYMTVYKNWLIMKTMVNNGKMAVDELSAEEETLIFQKLKDAALEPTMKNLVNIFLQNYLVYKQCYKKEKQIG